MVSELATIWPSSELRECNKAEGRATIARTSPVPASTPEWRKKRPQAPLMNLNRASSKTPDTQAWAGNLRRKGSSRYRQRVQSRNLLLSTAARDPQTPRCPPHMVRCYRGTYSQLSHWRSGSVISVNRPFVTVHFCSQRSVRVAGLRQGCCQGCCLVAGSVRHWTGGRVCCGVPADAILFRLSMYDFVSGGWITSESSTNWTESSRTTCATEAR